LSFSQVVSQNFAVSASELGYLVRLGRKLRLGDLGRFEVLREFAVFVAVFVAVFGGVLGKFERKFWEFKPKNGVSVASRRFPPTHKVHPIFTNHARFEFLSNGSPRDGILKNRTEQNPKKSLKMYLS
jgi:hypothetical protein